MDYRIFKNWKSPHSAEMQNLEFASAGDIFIFTRFTAKRPFDFEGKELIFARSIEETIGYIRHIFLYDILNDSTDDVETNLEPISSERQRDAISLLNYWFKFGKLANEKASKKELLNLCESFNAEFSCRTEIEYELQILFGADELRAFLIKHYGDTACFSENELHDFCRKDSFSGEKIKKFIHTRFS